MIRVSCLLLRSNWLDLQELISAVSTICIMTVLYLIILWCIFLYMFWQWLLYLNDDRIVSDSYDVPSCICYLNDDRILSDHLSNDVPCICTRMCVKFVIQMSSCTLYCWLTIQQTKYLISKLRSYLQVSQVFDNQYLWTWLHKFAKQSDVKRI